MRVDCNAVDVADGHEHRCPPTGAHIRFRIGPSTLIGVLVDPGDYAVNIRLDGTSQRAVFLLEDMRDIEVDA